MPERYRAVGRLFHLLEKFAVLFEDRERFREIRELEIYAFELSEDGAAHGFDLLLRNIRLTFPISPSGATCLGMEYLARRAETDVGKVAIRVPAKGRGLPTLKC